MELNKEATGSLANKKGAPSGEQRKQPRGRKHPGKAEAVKEALEETGIQA